MNKSESAKQLASLSLGSKCGQMLKKKASIKGYSVEFDTIKNRF